MPDGCGGTIEPISADSFEGTIQSPNYGHVYFPNLDCMWVLNISSAFGWSSLMNLNNSIEEQKRQNLILMEDQKISIEFIDFDVATTVAYYTVPILRKSGLNSCQGDYVEVFNFLVLKKCVFF